jgi:hypothetical protein
MIFDLVALVAANVVFLLAGLGMTRALGLWRSPRGGASHLAVAYMAGAAGVGVAAQVALVAGLSLSVPEVVAGCVAFAGLMFVRRPERGDETPVPQAVRAWPLRLVLGSMLVALAIEGAVQALDTWDAFAMWTMKARAIVVLGGLDPGLFASQAYHSAHLDYPLLLPALQAIDFRFMGAVDTQVVHEQTVLLLVGWLLASARILRGRADAFAIWAALGLAAVAPATITLVQEGYADVPVALFGALAALCAWLYIAENEARWAGLLAAFAAASAATKREAWTFALGLFVVAIVFALRRRRPLLPLIGGVGVLAATVGVWLGWLAWHGYTSHDDVPLSKSIDPTFLIGRIGRAARAIVSLGQYSARPSLWLVVIPLALLASAGSVGAIRRGPAGFLLATLVLEYASLVWAFWISRPPIRWHLDHAAPRVVATPVFVAATFLPLVVASAVRARWSGTLNARDG